MKFLSHSAFFWCSFFPRDSPKLPVPLSHEEILSFHHSFLHCLTPFLFPACVVLLILVDSILISLYFNFFALILYLLSALVSGNPLHFILYLSCPSLCFFFVFPFNQDINMPKVFLKLCYLCFHSLFPPWFHSCVFPILDFEHLCDHCNTSIY